MRETGIHGPAARVERRVARAFEKSAERMRAILPMRKLEAAIADRDFQTIRRILDEWGIESPLTPNGRILRDAFMRGGRTAAEEWSE